MLNQIPQLKNNIPRCSFFREIKSWKCPLCPPGGTKGSTTGNRLEYELRRNNILAGGDADDSRSQQHPHRCSLREGPCPGRGGTGCVGLGHSCLSPPVSRETSGLAERVCFGWVVREALQIPTALRGTEWVLGTGRGHPGQGTHGRGDAEMGQ